MDLSSLLENLRNPALMFFLLGIISVMLKSDLKIPSNSSKFISLYLLFCIGFKGGQELIHSELNQEIGWSILFGLALSTLIPLYTFYILKRKLNAYDAGAIAAAYGSVSAVTFVTAANYLEAYHLSMKGHMVAIMALMESPAIVVGLILIRRNEGEKHVEASLGSTIRHCLTNGSVLLLTGSLLIGLLTDGKHAEGIKPFTNDIFKGFLAIFLLDMGITTGKQLSSFLKHGWFPAIFAMVVPLLNGSTIAYLSQIATLDPSARFTFAILAASASYIAVPAAMKIAVPKASAGLFLPMALAITFPLNITIGFPIYYAICLH